MPEKDVHTIRDLIFYQYAKVVVKSALNLTDAEDAKQRHYGFIKSTFRGFIYGNKTWAEITKEDTQLVEEDKKCLFCGSTDSALQWEQLVPKSLSIKPECSDCERLLSVHNQVMLCQKCNSAKGTLGLYEFYQKLFPDIFYFYDFIPRLIEKKYLETIYYCHQCSGTLEKSDIDGDGKLTVLDIDYILH